MLDSRLVIRVEVTKNTNANETKLFLVNSGPKNLLENGAGRAGDRRRSKMNNCFLEAEIENHALFIAELLVFMLSQVRAKLAQVVT